MPIAIAYAQIAGFPPEVGIYSAIFPPVAYALFGTSRQLIVNPDSATCASTDWGSTWEGPVRLTTRSRPSFDHTSLLVRPNAPNDVVTAVGMLGFGDLPPLSAPYVARSTDGGRVFGPAKPII